MIYGSVCSGIEAAHVAWAELGWEQAWSSEIEPFPCRLLEHYYPEIPNLGDMNHVKEKAEFSARPIELLVGGTPCQSFSIAGFRKGLDDSRGNLALVFLGLVARARPRWVVWENVPGVLSSGAGRDFGAFLGGLGQLGYGWVYRVLDAQFFGVPQRRRRVFVVASPGGWQRPGAVLFDAKSLSGDPPPGRQAGEGIAPCVTGGAPFGRTGNEWVEDQALIPEVAGSLGRRGTRSHTELDGHGAYIPEISLPLKARDFKGVDSDGGGVVAVLPPPVMFKIRGGVEVDSAGKSAGKGFLGSEDLAFTLATMQDQWLGQASRVRRLTPRECERLQGFPDDYTAIPGAKDGPRYKALGNSMAVPVMKWIGQRIQMVEDLKL